MITVKQILPVKLTDEKRAELQALNAEIDIAVDVEKEKLAEAKAEYTSNTKQKLAQKKINLLTLRQGYEMKEIEASEYINEAEGTIEYYDTDGVKIHERALSIEERRQYKINFAPKPVNFS